MQAINVSRPTAARPNRLAVLALVLFVCSGPALADTGYSARDGGPTQSEMLVRGSGGIDGLDFMRPVLSGVLYRAGFKGGDRDRSGLSHGQLEALCEAGFSSARYIDFGTKTRYGTTACGSNSLVYESGRSGSTHDLMKDLHEIIENPEAGPMLVHCMWGVHSSGAVSAMALVQFCDWSEAKAKRYWNEARNNAPCGGGCDKWIEGKIARFKVDPALKISAEQQRAICPQ